MDQPSSAGSDANGTPALDLAPLAPSFEMRVGQTATILYFSALIASQIPAWAAVSSNWSEGLAFAAPLVLLLIASWYSSETTKSLKQSFVEKVLSRARLQDSPDNRAIALRAFEQRYRTSDSVAPYMLLAIIGLATSFWVIFWDDRTLSLAHFWDSLGRVVVFLGLLLLALVCGLAPAALTVANTLEFADAIDPETVSKLELPESERNDIDLVSANVALQSVQRRVETFTIESTLLSALSFSAFTAMIYSEKGPLEDGDWIVQLPWKCWNLPDVVCVPTLGLAQLKAHLMFLIAAFLLACAVSFVAVLITRLRFNEAFRYTEEVIKTAEALNLRENASKSAFKSELTQEISKLLDRAKHGLADLAPMVSFMKFFRELGIFCFMGAVATCGMYFHWSVTLLIVSLFCMAAFFGHFDEVRRRRSFLPKLQTTILRAIVR